MDGYLWGKNSINATIGGVGIPISSHSLKSLNSIEKPQLRIICAISNGNPCATILSCYSHTNGMAETDIATFYNGIFSFARYISIYNAQIVSRDMNRQRRK